MVHLLRLRILYALFRIHRFAFRPVPLLMRQHYFDRSFFQPFVHPFVQDSFGLLKSFKEFIAFLLTILRAVSWYKYLIVSLFFSHLGFWSGNLFLIAPFPDLCLLVPLGIPFKYILLESLIRTPLSGILTCHLTLTT